MGVVVGKGEKWGGRYWAQNLEALGRYFFILFTADISIFEG